MSEKLFLSQALESAAFVGRAHWQRDRQRRGASEAKR